MKYQIDESWIAKAYLSLFTRLTITAIICIPTSSFATEETCIIADSHFSNGVVIYAPREGHGHQLTGGLTGLGTDSGAVWGLSQWNTVLPFVGMPKPMVKEPNRVEYDSGSKKVTFGARGTKYADVTLELNSQLDYRDGVRHTGQRWPHLLLQQDISTKKALSGLKKIAFDMDAKLLKSENLHPQGTYNPKQHAAQFTVYFTIQNLDKKSRDYGRYVWFGIPIYDNRERIPEYHEQKDSFTGKFIYRIDYTAVASQSLQDGHWVHLGADVAPEIIKALRIAAESGYFSSPLDLAKFYITAVNLGWEMPGTFDSAIQVKDMSMCVQ